MPEDSNAQMKGGRPHYIRQGHVPRGCEPPRGGVRIDTGPVDIDDVPSYNFVRLQLNIKKELGNALSSPFHELYALIYEFRRGEIRDDDSRLTDLAHRLRWQPKNDKNTLRRFLLWQASMPRAQAGQPDAYTLLVIQALWLMRDQTRETTPQPVRLNRQWVTGKRRNVVPARDLPIAKYIAWFRNEVTRIIKNQILPELDENSTRHLLDGEEDADGNRRSSAVDRSLTKKWHASEHRKRHSGVYEEEQLTAPPARAIADLHRLSKQARDNNIKLSPTQRAIFDLVSRDPDLQTYADIESRLNIARRSTGVQIAGVRKKLKKVLGR